MPRRTMSVKVQEHSSGSLWVYLPYNIVTALGIKKGDTAEFELRGDLIVIRIVKNRGDGH